MPLFHQFEVKRYGPECPPSFIIELPGHKYSLFLRHPGHDVMHQLTLSSADHGLQFHRDRKEVAAVLADE